MPELPDIYAYVECLNRYLTSRMLQRIRSRGNRCARDAANETNYCPRCQIGGKVLADRSLSRLLKSDWPRSIEELEG